jgi:hypothetical protein
MILGFSHQAICLPDFSSAAHLLRKFGYVEQFHEFGLPNPHEKRAFLNDLPSQMDLVYFCVPDRPAIELVRYPGPQQQHCSPYCLAVSPDLAAEVERKTENDLGELGWMQALCTAAIILPSQRPEKDFASYGLLCSEFEESKTFWTQGLGFKEISVSNRALFLSRNAALPQWRMELYLWQADYQASEYFLNAEGLTVLSFISNDVAADGLLLGSLGAQCVSEVFKSWVNQRYLTIQLIRGPSGELIELISL